ncbi:MAG TPA: amino acid ABC transporter substrate-binding protein [Kineosporiaceae bacterium]
MTVRRAAVLALVVSCALMSLGCSSGGAQTITLGVSLPLTGSLAKEGALTKEGYQLCIDKINGRGGLTVGSRTVRFDVTYVDDGGRADAASRAVDDFNARGIKLVLGSYGSVTTAAEAAAVERNGQVLLDSAGADDAIFSKGYRRTFAVLSPASEYASSIVKAIDELANPAPRTIAFLSADDGFSRTGTASGLVVARALGMQVLGTQYFPSGSTDVRKSLTRVKAVEPDVVIGSVHLAEGLAIVRQARELGISPLAIGETVAPPTEEFVRQLGSAAEGVLGSSQWAKTVAGRDDVFGTASDYAAAVQAAYGHPADYHHAEASAACLALALALRDARTDEPDRVVDALAELAAPSFFGPLRFDSSGKNVSKQMVVIQIQRGVPVTVWPPGSAEAPLVWPALQG